MTSTQTTVEFQPHVKMVCGQPGEEYQLALIVKRTYRILPDGTCALAEEQEAVEEETEQVVAKMAVGSSDSVEEEEDIELQQPFEAENFDQWLAQ